MRQKFVIQLTLVFDDGGETALVRLTCRPSTESEIRAMVQKHMDQMSEDAKDYNISELVRRINTEPHIDCELIVPDFGMTDTEPRR